MIESVERALIAASVQPPEAAATIAGLLAPALIAEGWIPPPAEWPQEIRHRVMADLWPGRTEPGDLDNPRLESREAVTEEARPTAAPYQPTVVTAPAAGPQGCVYRYPGGRWCALIEGHDLPHVPAASVRGS